MTLSIPINIATDIVVEGAIHPAPLPPVPNGAVAIADQQHPPGVLLHTAKLTRSVTHRTMPIVQQGHDCGPGITHLTFPVVANPWLAVIIPGSSCKATFGASTVKVNGKPVAMTGLVGAMLPMLTCAFPVPLPTAFSVSTFNNTVKAGMTPFDIALGLVQVALKMIFSALLNRIWPPGTKLTSDSPGWDFVKQGLKRIFPTTKGSLQKRLLKTALGSYSKFLISTLQGDPTFQVSGGKVGLGYKVKVKEIDGELKPTLELNAGGMQLNNHQISIFGQEL